MTNRRAFLALPILLILAGCGGGSNGSLTPATQSPTGHIAYVQQRQIVPEGATEAATDVFVRRADGSGLTLLSAESGQSLNLEPAIAPDGRRVAFVASNGGRTRRSIFVVNANGSGLRRVLEASAFINSLSWTPDGQNLIYVAAAILPGNVVGKNFIYRARAEGDSAPQLVFDDGKARFSPALSPDGRTLAYISDERDETGAGEIFVARLDGAGRATGTPRALTSDELFKSSLRFAPNGQRLVYAIVPPNPRARVQFNSVNLDGTPTPALPAFAYGAVSLNFSPDGNYIAFTRDNSVYGSNAPVPASRVLIARADGSGEPRVLSGDEDQGSQFSPSWGR